MRNREPWAGAAAAVFALLLAGCGSAADDPAAARAAHFYAALSAGNAAGACADLAPRARAALVEQKGAPCEQVILDQDIPTVAGRGTVRVYGSMAQVRHFDETAFLSRFRDGWRVTAVGCTPTPGDLPYDCVIEVG